MIKFLKILAFVFCAWTSWSQEFAAQPESHDSARHYFDAMNVALADFAQGKISPLEFERVFFPKGDMQFFLSYNFDNPEVSALLQRIQKARVSEAVASNISSYISGQQKQRDIYIRKAHPELAKPVPLLSGGFAPPDPPPSTTPDPKSAPLWLNKQKADDKPTAPSLGPAEQSPSAIPSNQTIPSPPQADMAKTGSKSIAFQILAVISISVLVVVGTFFIRRKPQDF